MYDEKTGKREMRGGKPVTRLGKIRTYPPCMDSKGNHRPGGCKKVSPESHVALTNQNWKAYIDYLERKACNGPWDDPIVRKNAAIIRSVEDQLDQESQQYFRMLVDAMLMRKH